MEIKGLNGYLSDNEKKATGLESPVLLTEINCEGLLANLSSRRSRIIDMQEDYDQLTNAQRGAMNDENLAITFDMVTIQEMAGQVMAHETEVFLQKPQNL